MGMFDTIRDDNSDREGQVKLWYSEMKTYSIGDRVPIHVGCQNSPSDYSIAMREGGYVNICEDRIESWTDKPTFSIVVDKYGDTFDPDTFQGLMGEAGFGNESYFH